MTWKLLQLAFPFVFIGIAFYQYRNNRAVLVGFRQQLAVSPKGRRFVSLMALLTLLVYHFIALCGSADPLQLLPSSVLSFTLFSQRYGEAIMRLYQRKGWPFYALLIILAAFLGPETTPMAVTLMILLVTSWVYPTKELMEEMSERDDTPDIIEDTIEGLRKQMANVNPIINFATRDVPEEIEDAILEPCELNPDSDADVKEDVEDTSAPSDKPSEKAIRNRHQREKERARRHSRAKRRARRAKHGH